MSCSYVAKVLFLDDDTIRACYRLYQQDGFDGLVSFGYDGSACSLSDTQQDKLKAWISETLPRTTSAAGAWMEKEFGITCETYPRVVALLHRPGMERKRQAWHLPSGGFPDTVSASPSNPPCSPALPPARHGDRRAR
jgi:transposase